MKVKIPFWINSLQVLLIMIMLSQVYLFYIDIESVIASGVTVNTVSDYNLIYEFAARTATMAIVSIIILFSQDIKLFLLMFIMNILREGQETIIDPLFPLINAPISPMWDLILHVIIVIIEIIALLQLYKLLQNK